LNNGNSAVGFGPHLMFHGFRCEGSRLDDLDLIYRTLEALPDRIRMTKIMPPYVFRNVSSAGTAVGCSGFVLIAQSHISIHTFPRRGIITADIFSCDNFEVQDALASLKDAFQPTRVEWHLLDRGREFPRDIAGSKALVEQERRRVATALGLEALR
jgi:S-adenosylmethionine decarboxylase